jgi:hypothetical protein
MDENADNNVPHQLELIGNELQKLFKRNGIHGIDNNGGSYGGIESLWNFMFKTSRKKRKQSKKKSVDVETTGETNQLVFDSVIEEKGKVWYEKAYNYWENEANCPITDDGVLGGFGKLTPVDVRDSNIFLNDLQVKYPFLTFDSAVDCGAGIGRVTKHLLLPRCQSVTLVEQSPRLLNSAPQYLFEGREESLLGSSKKVHYIQQGLQVTSAIFSLDYFRFLF